MPKMRGIKPEFWTDEDICELSIPARLLFIGLWSYACDNGHVQDKPKQIKRRVLPDDDVNASELIREMAAKGLIIRSDGWIAIPNFRKHQKLDKRWFQVCDAPGCRDSKPETRSGHTEDTASPRSEHARPPRHSEGEGEGEEKKTTSSSGRAQRGSRLTEEWRPSTEKRDALAAEFPSIDQTAEFWKFQDYWMSKSGRDAAKVDWDRTYSNWIRNAAERQPVRNAASSARSEWNHGEQPPDDPAEYEQWIRDRAARRTA